MTSRNGSNWSATVEITVVDQLLPFLEVMASRLPIWMSVDGEFTVTVVDAWLLVALSSLRLWLAVSVWPPIVLPLVFQLKVSVVAAPAASAVIVCGANGAPSGASWSVTSNAPTGWLPTFFTVTLTFTVAPWVTAAGPVTLVTAPSVTGAGGGGGAPPSTCTPKLLSTRSMRFAIVWVELPANKRPTGFLFWSSVTIKDPESPPPENDPGSMMS